MMARIPVTYEQVAAVANALHAQGIKDPGTKAIREELARRAGPGGTVGSPNTIQGHLNRWRAERRPVDAAEVPQLPAQLAADIGRALTAAASVARQKIEERLAQVQAEFDELVAVGEASDARIEELMHELAARTSERDSMAGQLAERTAEAAKMQAEIDQARAGQAEAQARGTEAEKRAIAAAAHLEGERSAKAALEAQLAEQQGALRRLEGEAARAAGAEASAAGLREQMALLADTVAMLRGLLQAAGKDVPPASSAPSGRDRRQSP
jgi:chromosome segregation ATPase